MPIQSQNNPTDPKSVAEALRAEFLLELKGQLALIERGPVWPHGEPFSIKGAWWWCDEDGNIIFTLKFRSNPLALASGKSTAIVGTICELKWLIEGLMLAVERGLLDGSLTTENEL